MANLTETATFDANVYQLASTDDALAGPGSIMNSQAQALANRTQWLKGVHDRGLFNSGYNDVTVSSGPFQYTILTSDYGKLVRLASTTSTSCNFILPAVSSVPDGTVIGFENAAGGTKNMVIVPDGSENFKSSIGNINYSLLYLWHTNRVVIMKVGGLSGGWLLLEHDNLEVGHLRIIPDIAGVEKYGWLKCDGSTYSGVATSPYRRLFDKIGLSYGGSGTNFDLPNIAPISAGGINHYYYIKY